jgi:hypothetical protein
MRTHQHAHQGEASHKEVHRDSGPARGAHSPIGPQYGARIPDGLIRRDEDFASAPMERHNVKGVPEINARGGVTTVKGSHGPSGSPRDQGRSGEVT